MITSEQAKAIRTSYDAHEKARKAMFPGKCSFTQDMLSKLPSCPSNDDLAELETWEFCNDIPDKYFAYVKINQSEKPVLKSCSITDCIVTGFMGNVISKRAHLSERHYGNFGNYWRELWFTGINGAKYQGRYYESSGDYCRVKRVK